MSNLEGLIHPKSVALVGVSDKSLRRKQYDNFQRLAYPGDIYLVNQSHETLFGERCYKNLGEIEGEVDLAYLLVPAAATPSVLEEAGQAGVKAAIIVASGFAEVGNAAGQRELQHIAQRYGMELCGPNCTGVLNLVDGLPASISQLSDLLEPVPDTNGIALLTQSGAFGTMIGSLATAQGLNLAYFISTGNEAALGVGRLSEHLVEDDHVGAIACYLEELRDAPAFLSACEKAHQRRKLVVVVKTGRSAGGRRAVSSHTASIAGSDEAYDALFAKAHVVRADDETHLLDILAWQQASPHKQDLGKRLCIVSMSGGAGALMADQCESANITMPAASPALQSELRPLWPAFASLRNPVDLTGAAVRDARNLRDSLHAIDRSGEFDTIILFMNRGLTVADDVCDAVEAIHTAGRSEIGVVWVMPPAAAQERLGASGVPVFPDTARAIRSLGSWADHRARFVDARVPAAAGASTGGRAPTAPLRGTGRARSEEPHEPEAGASELQTCADYAALEELAGHGLTVVPGVRVASAADAVAAADRVGFPCVLKVDRADLTHKSDISGVIAGIANPTELVERYEKLVANIGAPAAGSAPAGTTPAGAADAAVLVEPMVRGVAEVMIGTFQDPSVGHVMGIGLGGTLVELLGGLSYLLLPASRTEIRDALLRMPGGRLLDGYRDVPPGDVAALIDAAAAIGRFVVAHGDVIEELDVNPIIVGPAGAGATAVDALIVRRRRSEDLG